MGQSVFGCDTNIPIKHTLDWVLLHWQKQAQIKKDNIRKNSKIVDHHYKVGDKFMITDNAAFKYETPYNVQF